MLLHLCSPVPWRMALATGAYTPPSLVTEGFIHLSTPEQVTLPANALYAGRADLALLVIDPDRLPGEVRWEGGRPDDPLELCFPHLYGALPTAAVVAVVPYRPGADGRFAAPVGLPPTDDVAARVRGFERSLAERRAAAVVPVSGGVAVVDPRFPDSYEHNTLWITSPTPAAVVAGDADRVMSRADRTHRAVTVEDALTARGLAVLGWSIDEERLLALTGDLVASPSPAVTITAVTQGVVGALWQRSWRRDLPEAGEATITQLVQREALTDAVVRVVDLAVLDAGKAVAGTQLRIDGATAAIEAVMTEPERRGRQLATALVADAVRRARAAGCDLVMLSAAAGDWPRQWYERLGFTEVGRRFQARRA